MIRKIAPELAAVMMGKGPQFIRIGLQRNLLPFGIAVPTGGTPKRPTYTYHISAKKFMEYTGFTEQDILAAADEQGFDPCTMRKVRQARC